MAFAGGRLDLEGFLDEQLLRNGFDVLPVGPQHAVGVHGPPQHHDDPFDRLRIAKTRSERVPILSTDSKFGPYTVRILR